MPTIHSCIHGTFKPVLMCVKDARWLLEHGLLLLNLAYTEAVLHVTKFHTVMSTRGHPYKLFKERSTNTVRKNFFSQRVVNAWNYLAADPVDFRSLRSFTRTIKLVDFSSFLRCF